MSKAVLISIRPEWCEKIINVYPYRCLKHRAERFSEEELERRFFSGEECEDFEQRRWPDGNDSCD